MKLSRQKHATEKERLLTHLLMQCLTTIQRQSQCISVHGLKLVDDPPPAVLDYKTPLVEGDLVWCMTMGMMGAGPYSLGYVQKVLETRESVFRPGYLDVTVHRAPQYDAWAAQGSTGTCWEERPLPTPQEPGGE